MNRRMAGYVVSVAVLTACGPKRPERERPAEPLRVDGTPVTVVDTVVDAVLDAAGVAEPFQQATLSTKLTGTVVEVLVREGDIVRAGQPLVRIDARDLTAKAAQVAASVVDVEASHREALAQATRIRGLYADSAATKAQLDAAETRLARADAAVRGAQAAAAELKAVTEYAVVRASFAGVVTRRFVDVGAFAAPGGPLVTLQDVARLRVSVSAEPNAVRALRRGAPISATIENRVASAVVEGVVPAPTGNLYTVNAIVPNGDRAILAGSAATLRLPLGRRAALVVPATALRREGDLTGVFVRTSEGDALRWVRVGHVGEQIAEVTSGLRAGEQIVVPDVQPAHLVPRRN